MESYRLSFLNNLKASSIILIMLATIIGFHIYAIDNYQYYNFKAFLIFLTVTSPMWGLAIFIHIEYLILNWKSVLEIDIEKSKFRYEDDKKEVEASFDNISKLIKHQVKDSALLYGFYEYYEIVLKNGETFIITNLMARNFSIPGIETEVIKCYFPSVWWYNQ